MPLGGSLVFSMSQSPCLPWELGWGRKRSPCLWPGQPSQSLHPRSAQFLSWLQEGHLLGFAEGGLECGWRGQRPKGSSEGVGVFRASYGICPPSPCQKPSSSRLHTWSENRKKESCCYLVTCGATASNLAGYSLHQGLQQRWGGTDTRPISPHRQSSFFRAAFAQRVGVVSI